jgi:hypothetical protein
VMLTPLARVPGGSRVRKRRAALEAGEKGLKRVVISVMKRVIIFGRGFFEKNLGWFLNVSIVRSSGSSLW